MVSGLSQHQQLRITVLIFNGFVILVYAFRWGVFLYNHFTKSYQGTMNLFAPLGYGSTIALEVPIAVLIVVITFAALKRWRYQIGLTILLLIYCSGYAALWLSAVHVMLLPPQQRTLILANALALPLFAVIEGSMVLSLRKVTKDGA